MKFFQSLIVISISTVIVACGGGSSSTNNDTGNDTSSNPNPSSDVVAPVIQLNGANPMRVSTGNTYQEPNALATDDVDGSVPVLISGNVNTAVAGVYTMTYSALDAANNTASVTRIVNVVNDDVLDDTAPVIQLNGANPMSLSIGSTYQESSAQATDDVDGSVSISIFGNVNTAVVGVYTITYSASDAASNATSVTRIVNVVNADVPDDTAPVIQLNGANPMNLSIGDTYQEPNAQATDDVDGSVPVSISSNVNTAVAGVYTITYSALDTANNTASVTRTVNVLAGQVDVYPSPGQSDGIAQSDAYKVSVVQHGKSQDSYVNKSVNNYTKSNGANQPEISPTDAERDKRFNTETNHWTNFSFEEPVTVTVEALKQANIIGNVIVRPNHRDIQTTVSGNRVSFEIDRPGNFYVYIEGEEKHPLFVFANPLAASAPNINDANVYSAAQIKLNPSLLKDDVEQTIYFAPGVHVISEPVIAANGLLDTDATEAVKFPTLPSNTTVYVDGGAYVKGLISIHERVDNVHFMGRGVLSGVDYPHEASTWANHMIHYEGYNQSTNMSVEGLTIVDGPKTCLTARSGPIVIDNIKCLSWHANSDGVSSGNGSIVRNSFFKVFDDVIKLFHKDLLVEDNVIWHQRTGSVFHLSWNTQTTIDNIRVNNTDIIVVERELGNVFNTLGSASDYPDGSRQNGVINNALLSSRNLKGGNISDVVIDTVRYDEQPFQLLQLQLKDHRTGFTHGIGDIDNITLRNISMVKTPRVENYILDNGIGEITNINIEDFNANGQVISADDFLLEETTNPQ